MIFEFNFSSMNKLEQNIGIIFTLCQKHKVKDMYVFGSVLTDRFNDASDIDMLVEFNKEDIDDYFSNFFDLKYELEGVLGREVDLVENSGIRNPYFRKSVDDSKKKIYG